MGQTLPMFLFVSLGLFFLGLAVGAVASKLGRLLCARVGSIPIRRMVIGRGPVLVCGRIGDMRVEVRLVPTGAVVTCAESPSMPKRSAVLLHLLSGALASVVVIGVIIWLHLAGVVPTILRNDVGTPVVIAQLGILVFAQLLVIAGSVAEPFVYAGSRQITPYREGTTRPPISTRSLGFVRLMHSAALDQMRNTAESRRKAWAALQREVGRGDLTAEEEMFALDWLITHGLAADRPIFGDPMLRPKLDEWSERALRLGPKVKTLVGSRGAVLVELGRYREGKALLQTIAAAKAAPLFDALLVRIFLARAEHALGNAAAARSLIAQARALARAGVRPPAPAAWMRRLQRELREMRFRRRRPRPGFGRRSLKGQSKLSLLRLRSRQEAQPAAWSARSRWLCATGIVFFAASVSGLTTILLPNQSNMHRTPAAATRPNNNPPPDPQLNEEVVKLPVTLTLPGGTLHKGEFVLTTFKPTGPGPFPAVVISHGRDGSPRARAEFGRNRMRYYWVQRGFAVLAPTRIGYGASGTSIDPEYAAGSCDAMDFAPLASSVMAHIRATIEYAAAQAWIDKENLVLAGVSVGGFGSVVAAGESLPGVKALVNFAGGAGGWSQLRPEQPCSPRNIELQLVASARRGAIPSIWFYAENDRLWGAQLPRTWHAAYVEAGGTAEFHMLPPLQEDGHDIIAFGGQHWRPQLDRFLTSIGFALRKLQPPPPAVNLSRRCLEAYDFFLDQDMPRAFATSPGGGCATAVGRPDAMAELLALCEKVTRQPCSLYAINERVVWRPW